MKISYNHPQTQKRTSITLSDRLLRLWALTNSIDVIDAEIETDDWLYNEKNIKLLKESLVSHHQEFLKGYSNYPTFTSYFENIVLIDVEHRLFMSIRG